MIISQPLKQALADTGVSAAELARRLGVSRAHISQLTSGSRGATPEALNQIAEALNCTVSITVQFEPKT